VLETDVAVSCVREKGSAFGAPWLLDLSGPPARPSLNSRGPGIRSLEMIVGLLGILKAGGA
jgi:hypothetical protein